MPCAAMHAYGEAFRECLAAAPFAWLPQRSLALRMKHARRFAHREMRFLQTTYILRVRTCSCRWFLQCVRIGADRFKDVGLPSEARTDASATDGTPPCAKNIRLFPIDCSSLFGSLMRPGFHARLLVTAMADYMRPRVHFRDGQCQHEVIYQFCSHTFLSRLLPAGQQSGSSGHTGCHPFCHISKAESFNIFRRGQPYFRGQQYSGVGDLSR